MSTYRRFGILFRVYLACEFLFSYVLIQAFILYLLFHRFSAPWALIQFCFLSIDVFWHLVYFLDVFKLLFRAVIFYYFPKFLGPEVNPRVRFRNEGRIPRLEGFLCCFHFASPSLSPGRLPFRQINRGLNLLSFLQKDFLLQMHSLLANYILTCLSWRARSFRLEI